MTLIVARRMQRGIRLMGDIQVTDHNEIRRGWPIGALKVVIIDPDRCIAFAGTVDEALGTLRRLPRLASG